MISICNHTVQERKYFVNRRLNYVLVIYLYCQICCRLITTPNAYTNTTTAITVTNYYCEQSLDAVCQTLEKNKPWRVLKIEPFARAVDSHSFNDFESKESKESRHCINVILECDCLDS